MKRRLPALVSAVLLTTPLTVAVAAPPAHAAPHLVVYAAMDKDDPAHPVTVTVRVRGEGVARIRGWFTDSRYGPSWAALGDLRQVGGTSQDSTWQGTLPVSVEERPGQHWAVVKAEDADGRMLAQQANVFQACYTPVYSDITATPPVIHADRRNVTASGAISYRTSWTAPLQPAGALPVKLLGTSGTTETGADGRFTVRGDAEVRPELYTDAKGVVCQGRTAIPVMIRQTATMISALLSAPHPYPPGGEITVRGRLMRAVTGGPVFLAAGEAVEAWILPSDGSSSRYLGQVQQLGADGSYEFSFVPTSGELLVQYVPNSTGMFTRSEIRQLLRF